MSPCPPEHYLITVYEARNPKRRELFLGTTSLLSPKLAEEFAASPPPEISHWKPDDGASLSCLAYAIPAKEAREFMRKYARLRRRGSWRVRLS
jgi:hypothetical protein